MAYKQFVPLTNMNFQFNRVLCYGDAACREEDLWEIAPRLTKFDPQAWYQEWHGLAVRAESEQRTMHAAYYHRMSEFFLPDGAPEKDNAYQDFRRCFYQAVGDNAFDRFEIPYEDGQLPAWRMAADKEKGVILLHGGFDSFMEEFFLEMKKLPEKGYTVIAFEGPGQGRALRDGLKMPHEWEKPISSVLDFFNPKNTTLVGISLGGYLALRAAAFEPGIERVVAYDVVYDAFECFTNHLPEPMRTEFRDMVVSGKKDELNSLVNTFRSKDEVTDWGLTHGMYITGTNSPYDYFRYWTRFTTRDISDQIKQDVLLLAGENDHFIPVEMYHRQKAALVNARSVRGRIFTAEEGGAQHCQVGNPDLVWNEILDWLGTFHS
jgi:pimeloyl-ACP methyl ester carboxylesterase